MGPTGPMSPICTRREFLRTHGAAADGGPWELYDLDADRTELNNIAARRPEKVNELKALYESWTKRCGVLSWPIKRPKN